MISRMRKSIALVLCCVWPASYTSAQEAFIEPVKPAAPVLWRPYLAPEVPPIRLGNSPRLRDLVRAGRLYLTVHDAITLALENNIDVELARYSPIDAEWRVTRAEAGGALPGVPSGASQTVSVASGQGVLGSQAAAGVPGGNNGTVRGTVNASITQIGPVTQTLDPAFQEATTFSHRSLPQANVIQSITPVLVQDQRIYFGSLQEGFLTGGSVNGTYNNHYLRENFTTDVLNPSSFPTLNVFFEHSLLQGFGVAVNSRFITVAKINLQTSDLNFRTQVIGTVVNVLNAYYALVADYDDVKAKQAARDVAQTFYEDTRKRVELGALIELDVATAQSQLAASRQNLVNSQTALQQHEWQLKNLISRNGLADPVIASAHIVPLDRIVIPPNDDLPPLKEMVEMALANRSDLSAQKAGVRTSEVSALGTRNGVLPNLVAFASENQAGSAGGIGTALGQVFRGNFLSENAGAFFQAEIRNRQAQADYGIDQLQLRQQQLQTEKTLKQAQVDIMNAVVALRQARARYDTAVQNRVLQQQLFEGEQKKFSLGSSTPYNVVLQQRDLAAAQATEIGALVSYSNARVALDQATGRTLETNHISIAEARTGKVARPSSLPAALPPN